MGLRYLEGEAAVLFGMGLDDFLRRDPRWRAEMMAHLVLRQERTAFTEAKAVEAARRKSKMRGGIDPAAEQRKRWMV